MSKQHRENYSGWDHLEADEADLELQRQITRQLNEEAIAAGSPDVTLPIEPNETYSREQIKQMQILGMKKPKEITWGDWVGPADLSHRHDYFIHLAASGLTNNQIAEAMQMSVPRVCILLNNTKIKNKIKDLQAKLWGDGPAKRFQQIVSKAITKAETIMDSTEKDQLAADIAFRFMDRALGKPKQEVSVETNLLADLITRLDEAQGSAKDVLPIDLKEEKDDPLAQFVADHVPSDYKVGERKLNEQEETRSLPERASVEEDSE